MSNSYDSGSMREAAETMGRSLAEIKKDLTALDGHMGELWKSWDADSRRDMQKTVDTWNLEQEEINTALERMRQMMSDSGVAVVRTEDDNRDTAGGAPSGGTGNPYRGRL